MKCFLRKRGRLLADLVFLAAIGFILAAEQTVGAGSGGGRPLSPRSCPGEFCGGRRRDSAPGRSRSGNAAGEGQQGWAGLFSDVSDVFQGADFGFVNMETPVAPNHSKGSKPFMFDAPVALPEALKASGIKIVSFANNHVMDQGWAGFAETRDHLREVGLLFAGTGDTAQQAWQPVFTEANGIKVGWLGMTRWLNGNRNPDKDDQPHVNFFPYPGEAGGAPGHGRSWSAGRH